MKPCLTMFSVAEHDSDSLMRGVMDVQFKDLEDSCQYQLAQKAGCSALVTFNTSDYANVTGELSVKTPAEFLGELRP